jgi:tetratricopeptide (TPR) repeat protein
MTTSRITRRAPAVAVALFMAASSMLVTAPLQAIDGSREQRFEAANAAFAEGRFADARAGFAEIAASAPSVAVLYNLGNAAFRDGRIGEAVLSYERALLLAPRDPDTRANLRQVRKAAGLPEPNDGPWSRATRPLSASGWAWLASAGLYLACGALLGLRLVRGDGARATFRPALRAALASGIALLVVGGAACATRLAERDRAVVLDEDPVLRVAPYASATVSSELAPGEVVRIERSHEGFTLVRTAAGRSGWTTSAAVARIASAS